VFFEQWHKSLPTIPRIEELSQDDLLLACAAAGWNAALEWMRSKQETRQPN